MPAPDRPFGHWWFSTNIDGGFEPFFAPYSPFLVITCLEVWRVDTVPQWVK
jgi:hypothetical protein